MNPTPIFQEQQRQLLNYLRQPQPDQLPAGFAPARLSVYVELLYNKFDESLTACFPVIHRILPQTDWRALLLDFIAGHCCLSPYYRQIPDEFVQYLQQERQHPDDWPFLAELAHFEWIELQLSIVEAELINWRTLDGEQLLNAVPVYAPVMQLLQYQWPVEDIGPDYLPTDEPNDISYILGFRDRSDRVQFIALTTATAELVRLTHAGLTGRQALQAMADQMNATALERFLQFGQQTLSELNQRGTIVDCRAV